MALITNAHAEALEHMMRESTETPMVARDLTGDSSHIKEALSRARDRMANVLDTISTEAVGRLCPLPAGTMPGIFALQVIVAEAGIHTNDLAWAFGNEVSLSPMVVAAAAPALAAALPGFAHGSSEQPV